MSERGTRWLKVRVAPRNYRASRSNLASFGWLIWHQSTSNTLKPAGCQHLPFLLLRVRRAAH
eukprot:scaffold41531_cov21-Tisochrysis_lutea.AAC.7